MTVCCHPEILLQLQRDVMTSLYGSELNTHQLNPLCEANMLTL